MTLSPIQSLKLASPFSCEIKKKQNLKASLFYFQKENNYLCNSKLRNIGFNLLIIKGGINFIKDCVLI